MGNGKVVDSLSNNPKRAGTWHNSVDEDRVWSDINSVFPNYADSSKQQIADALQVQYGRGPNDEMIIPPNVTGQQLHDLVGNSLYLSPADVSQHMNNAGIAGIRYLDQGSRGAGKGSSNYVVFNDKTLSIMRKYGLAGLGIGIGASAATLQSMQPQQAQAAQ